MTTLHSESRTVFVVDQQVLCSPLCCCLARKHAAAPALALFLSLARSVSTSPGQREATEKILKSGRQSKADGNANEASKTKIHNRDGMQSEEEYNKVNKKA